MVSEIIKIKKIAEKEYLCKAACLTNLHTKDFKAIHYTPHSIFYLLKKKIKELHLLNKA